MNVHERSDSQRFVQGVEVGGGDRLGDHAVTHRAHHRAFLGANVESGMKALAAFAAAHLAHRAGDFEWAFLRMDGPQERGLAEGAEVESRMDGGRGWWSYRWQALRRNDSNERIAPVRHRQSSVANDGDTGRGPESCVVPRPVGEAEAAAGEQADADCRPDLDDSSTFVGDIEDARAVHRDSHRAEETAFRHRPHGRDDAGGGDHADRRVAGVGDVDVAGAIDGDAARRVESCRVRRTVDVTRRSARDGPHGAVGGNGADSIVIGVGDDDLAGGADGDAERPVEPGVLAAAVGGTRMVTARERRHRAVHGNAADGVVGGVGDEDRSVARDGNPRRRVELCVCGRAVFQPRSVSGQRGNFTCGRDPADAL